MRLVQPTGWRGGLTVSMARCLSPGSFPSPGHLEREDAPEKQELLDEAVCLPVPPKPKEEDRRSQAPLVLLGCGPTLQRGRVASSSHLTALGNGPCSRLSPQVQCRWQQPFVPGQQRDKVSPVLTGEGRRELAVRQIPEKHKYMGSSLDENPQV